jgi:diacylglycerol kinase (ATP)
MQQRAAGGLLRGTAAYVTTALGAIVNYGGILAAPSLSADPVTSRTMQHHLLLVFANGRYFGGAFHIAPTATIDSGLLDAVVIRDATPLRRLALFAKAMRGAHMSAAEVQTARGTNFTVSFATPPLFEVDGEVHQARACDVTISVRKAALRVVR